MTMHKSASSSIKLWSLLWKTWDLLLLLAIILTWAAPILDLHITPPNIYVFLAIVFFNGLVLSSLICLPSWVGISDESYINIAIAILVGLVQWFFIYQLGRLWLLNWKNHKLYWKLIFPIFLVCYYLITGLLSIYLFAIAVD